MTRHGTLPALNSTPSRSTTPHMFRRPDIFMMAGRILLNPPAITDEAALNLLVLRRELELPSDITDQTLFNLIALFRKEISSSPLLEATPTLSNFPFLDDLNLSQYVENTPVQKRSSISSEIRRGLGLFHLNSDPIMGIALRFITAFECALDEIWDLGTTPAQKPRGSHRLRYSAPGPATSGHVAMETDLPTNIVLPRLTGLVQDLLSAQKNISVNPSSKFPAYGPVFFAPFLIFEINPYTFRHVTPTTFPSLQSPPQQPPGGNYLSGTL